MLILLSMLIYLVNLPVCNEPPAATDPFGLPSCTLKSCIELSPMRLVSSPSSDCLNWVTPSCTPDPPSPCRHALHSAQAPVPPCQVALHIHVDFLFTWLGLHHLFLGQCASPTCNPYLAWLHLMASGFNHPGREVKGLEMK